MKGKKQTKARSLFALSLCMTASLFSVSSIRYVNADTNKEPTVILSESDKETDKSNETIESPNMIYSTADDLNLRSKPSTNAKSLKKIAAGEPMTILSETNKWYEVASGKKTGYVSKLYTNDKWIGFSSTENLNLRKTASKSGEVIDQFYQGDAMTILEKDGKWYKVAYGEKTGYVAAKYVDFQCNVYVNGENVNLRKSAHTESGIVKRLDRGVIVTLLEQEGNWYKVRYKKKTGYINASLLSFTKPIEETYTNNSNSSNTNKPSSSSSTGSSNNSSTSSPSNSSSLGQQIVNYAKQFVGNPYVYGGTSLTNGADCSGFVQSVYAHFGISLPRTSEAQRSAGYSVGSLSNARPGDLVCYYGHVGIYIGNNAIVHASNAKSGIKITYNAAYRSIASIRRVI